MKKLCRLVFLKAKAKHTVYPFVVNGHRGAA
jgi:hypothetical protein